MKKLRDFGFAISPDDPIIIRFLDSFILLAVTIPARLIFGLSIWIFFLGDCLIVSYEGKKQYYEFKFEYFDLIWWVYLLLLVYFDFLKPWLAIVIFVKSLRNSPKIKIYPIEHTEK